MGIWIVAQKEKVVTARIVLLSERGFANRRRSGTHEKSKERLQQQPAEHAGESNSIRDGV